MTLVEAVNIFDQLAAQASMNRESHANCLKAITMLREHVNKTEGAPPLPVSSADPCHRGISVDDDGAGSAPVSQ